VGQRASPWTRRRKPSKEISEQNVRIGGTNKARQNASARIECALAPCLPLNQLEPGTICLARLACCVKSRDAETAQERPEEILAIAITEGQRDGNGLRIAATWEVVKVADEGAQFISANEFLEQQS
jgi:hypothetical protein